MDPLDTASGRARGEARGANNARIAGAAAVLRMVREARRAQEQARTNVEAVASSRATTQVPAQASNVPKPVSPGQAEARMLRDMFQVGHAWLSSAHQHQKGHGSIHRSCAHHGNSPQCSQAVFPDMKGISGATRVAAYSGSLTLSLAFAGFVYVSCAWACHAPPLGH